MTPKPRLQVQDGLQGWDGVDQLYFGALHGEKRWQAESPGLKLWCDL